MEKTRPILYGVSDYAEIRKANAWFVDRTAKIRAAATDQLDKYSSDSKLVKEWRLNTGTTGILPVATGTVTLHRLVLVFHGGECVLSEEV